MPFRVLHLLLIPGLLCAEPAEDDAPPPKSVLQTALSWMQSSDPERRQAAYRSVHLLGEGALPGFEQALKAARKFHERRLGNLLGDETNNPQRALGATLEELAEERKRVLPLIMTDYKKAPAKIRMLREEVDRVSRIHERATRLVTTDPADFDREVDGIALALVEINDQLRRFEDHKYDQETDDRENDSLAQRKEKALRETFEGERYLQDRVRRKRFVAEQAAAAEVSSANDSSNWANAPQKDFATIQNRERAVMGLGPLRLEEHLSAASTGHSEDMRRLGFFAHNSPVEGKASPADRARKAGFTHRWTGENIYMGSDSPEAAYAAWFASDGHRFIMFAKGPNLLGLGPVGRHWTLMTGRR